MKKRKKEKAEKKEAKKELKKEKLQQTSYQDEDVEFEKVDEEEKDCMDTCDCAEECKQESKERKKNKKSKNSGRISDKLYEKELRKLQIELIKLQDWVRVKGLKVLVLFEGRDAAGKGGAIKRITEHMNPRFCKVVALAKPTERERSQWYFQRYVEHLPAAGEIVLFDRSWYNRAGVERVFGFCTDEEYEEFLRSCPQFEEMLIRSGIILIKYWFSVSDEIQEKRMQDRIDDPLKTWKFSDIDLESRKKWVEYSKAKDSMFERTDTYLSPWNVVESDIKKHARLNCIAHFLSKIPYEEVERKKFELPKIEKDKKYVRPDIRMQKFVPDYAAKVMRENGEE